MAVDNRQKTEREAGPKRQRSLFVLGEPYNPDRVNGVSVVTPRDVTNYLKLQRYDRDGSKVGDRGFNVGSLQSDLKMLGFDPGPVDWIYGRKVKAGVKAFQKSEGLPQTGIADPATIQKLGERVLGFDLEAYRASLPKGRFSFVPDDSEHFLDPELVRRMHADPKVADFVKYTMAQAEATGVLDPILMANQYWNESRFDPDAHSPKGARGIAQFMPSTGKMYGLKGSDLNDPYKSMAAGVQHMKDLTQKYGDQRLALFAYNGGQGALNFAKRSGVDPLTYEGVREFYLERRMEKGANVSSAWHVETLDYVTKIDSGTWPMGKRIASLQNLAQDQRSPAEVLASAEKRILARAFTVSTPKPQQQPSRNASEEFRRQASPTPQAPVAQRQEPVRAANASAVEKSTETARPRPPQEANKDSQEAIMPRRLWRPLITLALGNGMALPQDEDLGTPAGRMKAAFALAKSYKEHMKDSPSIQAIEEKELAAFFVVAALQQNPPDRMQYAFGFEEYHKFSARQDLWERTQELLAKWDKMGPEGPSKDYTDIRETDPVRVPFAVRHAFFSLSEYSKDHAFFLPHGEGMDVDREEGRMRSALKLAETVKADLSDDPFIKTVDVRHLAAIFLSTAEREHAISKTQPEFNLSNAYDRNFQDKIWKRADEILQRWDKTVPADLADKWDTVASNYYLAARGTDGELRKRFSDEALQPVSPNRFVNNPDASHDAGLDL